MRKVHSRSRDADLVPKLDEPRRVTLGVALPGGYSQMPAKKRE
jgi:hypothetical protein